MTVGSDFGYVELIATGTVDSEEVVLAEEDAIGVLENGAFGDYFAVDEGSGF